MDVSTQDRLADAFAEHRQRLTALAKKKLNPILLKRMSEEDVLSEAYVNAAKRLDYLAAHDDVPTYYKLRTILLQTICDIERRHLQAQGRDAYKELRAESGEFGVDDGGSDGDVCVGELPADITSPASRVDRDERHAMCEVAEHPRSEPLGRTAEAVVVVACRDERAEDVPHRTPH